MSEAEAIIVPTDGRLPLSLVYALKKNGVDPRTTSVPSAEAWSPESDTDLGSVDEDRETRALVASTLRRMCASVATGLDEETWAEFVSTAAAIEEDESFEETSNDLALAG
jgi:hypothetical protein